MRPRTLLTSTAGLLRRRALAAVPLLLLLLLAVAASGARAAPVVVTLGFDDGSASQYAQRAVLADHGVHATFFVNTNKLGQPGYMTWAQVRELADAGHEIGGHTLDHRSLPALSAAEQRRQVCDDRAALVSHGYSPVSFAYPSGLWNAAVKGVVADCGYTSARTTGGLDYPDPCCVFAETIPPRDPFAIRAQQPRSSTTVAIFEDAISRARSSGGGWVDLAMHDLCTGSCSGFDDYAVSVATLDAVLDWIDAQPDVTVKTTAEVMGADVTAPSVTLTQPANGAVVTGDVALAATASDGVGVTRVDFLVDGVVVASDRAAPWEGTWSSSGSSASRATVTAKAYDAAANVGTSAPSTVTLRSTAPTRATTFVTLGFDDGLASNHAHRSILSDHGVHATFFVNTNKLGQPGYMTWAQVRELADAGHEIGGHTLDHRSLPALSAAEQRRQVCDDRAALVSHGYSPVSFAYPSGLWNAAVKGVVADCGYTSARTTGGLDYPDPCCVFAETIPPRDPFTLRAAQPRLDTPLSAYVDLIERARDSGGGWVDLVLHGVCSAPCSGADEYDVSVATLDGLLDWIATDPRIAVASTAEVMALGSAGR